MLQLHNDELGHEMILVSRTGIIVFIVFSLAMTGLLMGLFMFVDFDSLLGRKHLAMKVGQTSIGMADFQKIKNISGERAKAMPDQAWAEELFTTLILAENARSQLLDQNPEIKNRAELFNSALSMGEDEERIARSVFLHEELAKAAIEKLLQNDGEYQQLLKDDQRSEKIDTTGRLHLRQITVVSEDELTKVLAEIASGTGIEQINASYSVSPYRGVGGDIGWKTASDFPEGVFNKLEMTKDGELVEGFRDESGIHLFVVINRPERKIMVSNEKQLQLLKNRLISKHLIKLRSETEYWINPSLRVMCQIAPDTPDKSN